MLFIFSLYLLHFLARGTFFTYSEDVKIETSRNVLFIFTAQACTACQSLLDLVSKTHSKYFSSTNYIRFYSVDVSLYPDMIKAYNVGMVPSIKLMTLNGNLFEYDLDMEPEDLRYFIDRYANNSISEYSKTPKLKNSNWRYYFTYYGSRKNSIFLQKFTEICFANEAIPCIHVNSIDEKLKEDLIEFDIGRNATIAYFSEYVKNKTQNITSPEIITVSEGMILQIQKYMLNSTNINVGVSNLTKLELLEIDSFLRDERYFRTVFTNTTEWRLFHGSNSRQILNFEKESLIAIRDTKYNRVKLVYLNHENTSLSALDFFENTQLNNIFLQFTHRLRKYMIKTENVGLILFAKTKLYSNNYDIQYFINQTEDMYLKSMNDKNWAHSQKAINSTVAFVIDPLESKMQWRLLKAIHGANDDIPAIYAFRFRNGKDFIERIKLNREVYFSHDLQDFVVKMYYDNVVKTYSTHHYFEERKERNKNIMLLNEYSHTKILDYRLNDILVIEYTTSYCRECFKMEAIIDILSSQMASIDSIPIKYSRLNLDKNDVANLPTKSVPLVRVFKPFQKNPSLELTNPEFEVIKRSIKEIILPVNNDL